MGRGVFAVVEGISGSGKSTAARSFVEALKNENGLDAILTAEPTERWYGQNARQAAKDQTLTGLAKAVVTAEYFFGDRVEHNATTIKPGLAAGAIVVSDRYDMSTLAYQSANGLSLDYLIARRESLIRLGVMERPDVTFLFRTPVDEALRRIDARGKPRSANENRERMTKLSAVYDLVARKVEDTVVPVDGTLPREEIVAQMLTRVVRVL